MIAYQADLSSNVVTFCRLLRSEGLPVGLTEEIDTMRAIGMIQISDPEEFRLTLRTILSRNRRDQERFDRLYNSFWHGKVESDSTHLPLRKKPSFQKPKQSLLNPVLGDWNESMQRHEEGIPGYSPLAILKQKDFSDFKDEDFKEAIEIVAKLKKILNMPRGLRYKKSLRREKIDFRRTMRLNLKNAGEVIDLAYKERSQRPMNLVLLCDVSGSMEHYSKFLIRFIYSLQFVYTKIETFVFSTSLSRMTGIVRRKSLKEVLQEISDLVPDWSGGTRIGECFENLLELHSDKINKNTVVIILSDGWDVGDVALLEQSMKTIHRKAKRVIWLNPLLSEPEYKPECAGMQAALPYIDDFFPAHNIASLSNLCNHLATTNFSRRKTA